MRVDLKARPHKVSTIGKHLDYRKHWTCVPHRRLIEKLKGFGINGKLLQWLRSFLTSRTMRVMLRAGNLFTDSGGVEWSSTR